MILSKNKYKGLDIANRNTNFLIRSPPQDDGFRRPRTDEEYRAFHKMNEDGLKLAYATPEGYYKDGNKLYIAGTRDAHDVYDWSKIVAGSFRNSKIYKNAEPIFLNNPNINYVVGHSAGGSAALELEKNYTDRKMTSVTYNAPVLEQTGRPAQPPMRFAIMGDPVSLLDRNAQTTYKAPVLNVGAVRDSYNMYMSPSLSNAFKLAHSAASFDPLMGLHTIGDSYSRPSTAYDYWRGALGLK